jgi:hypothetical protein
MFRPVPRTGVIYVIESETRAIHAVFRDRRQAMLSRLERLGVRFDRA